MANIQIINGVQNLIPENENEVNGFTIIDVRNPDEFTGDLGHIHGAKLSPLGGELQHYLTTIDKTKKYLFVCKVGGRSTQAVLFAKSIGFTDVTNLAGGMIRWNEFDFKTET